MSTLDEDVTGQLELEDRAEKALKGYLGRYAERARIKILRTSLDDQEVDLEIKWPNVRGYYDQGVKGRFRACDSVMTYSDFYYAAFEFNKRFSTAKELVDLIKAMDHQQHYEPYDN